MKLCSVMLVLFVAVAGGCDLTDSRCDPPEPHHCTVLCCDPACSGSGEGNSCSNVGYQCQSEDSLCTCGSNGTWHCTDGAAPKDLAVPVVADMAQPPGD